ncbi:MAG TPA: hypothetical protein VFW41_11815 [Gaiellaceae bacterium]|nr:hypothetical protein [Gaiellaceae bacterium]
MAAFSQLSVTTSAGTTTVPLGNENTITIDSPGGPPGTPAAAIRTPHTFRSFLRGQFQRIGLGQYQKNIPANRHLLRAIVRASDRKARFADRLTATENGQKPAKYVKRPRFG